MRMTYERLAELTRTYVYQDSMFKEEIELLQALKAEKIITKALLRDNRQHKAKLDAVQPLPDKWRKYTFDNPEATSYIDSADCADELEEALGEAK